jgi:hypothetical protein
VEQFTLRDIKPIEDYELTRRAFFSFADHISRERGVLVGPSVLVIFENRQTILFQLQETLRSSGIRQPSSMLEELEAYNRLLPGRNELVAVMLAEVRASGERTGVPTLPDGDSAVELLVGTRCRVRAVMEDVRLRRLRKGALAYLRFPLAPNQVYSLRKLWTHASIRIDGPGYQHQQELPMECRRSLLADLGSRTRPRSVTDGDGSSAK